MVDQLVSVTRQGFFGRVVKSFVGVLFGLLLIPGSFVLIGWNEYRTIHRTQGLTEASKVVLEQPDIQTVSSALDGKLVHASGLADTTDELEDPDFSINKIALRLERRVEMYQWVEKKESKTREKLGGGTETITTYDYRKTWESDRVNSESFHESNGHTNPQPAYASTTKIAQKVTLGAFQLSDSLVRSIDSWQDLPIDLAVALEKMPESERSRYKLENGYLFYSSKEPKPARPEIGDLRIRFRIVEPTRVSVLAGQTKEQLARFRTSNGEQIERLAVGNASAEEMFASLRAENTLFAWLLRMAGWLMASIGCMMILGPLSTIASVVPLLGRITGFATFWISVVLGAMISLVAIAIAWIAVRPLFAVGLFAVVGVGLYFLWRSRSRKQLPPVLEPIA